MTTIKKECQIVIIPTNEKEITKGQLVLNKESNSLYIANKNILKEDWNRLCTPHLIQPQHLYLISDDEIKKNDYVLIQLSEINIIEIRKVKNCDNENFIFDNDNQIYKGYCKKVIASTDTSLGLPQLPKKVIDAYALSYNTGSITLDKVMVEYELNGPYMGHFENTDCSDYTLKINESNEILISLIKNAWNKQEVIELAYKLLQATGREIRAEMMNIHTNPYINFEKDDVDRWLSENL